MSDEILTPAVDETSIPETTDSAVMTPAVAEQPVTADSAVVDTTVTPATVTDTVEAVAETAPTDQAPVDVEKSVADEAPGNTALVVEEDETPASKLQLLNDALDMIIEKFRSDSMVDIFIANKLQSVKEMINNYIKTNS